MEKLLDHIIPAEWNNSRLDLFRLCQWIRL